MTLSDSLEVILNYSKLKSKYLEFQLKSSEFNVEKRQDRIDNTWKKSLAFCESHV